MGFFLTLTSFLLWINIAPASANDDCHDDAKALLAIEQTLGEFFDGHNAMVVKQGIEWEEAAFNLETRNRYSIHTPEGQTLGAAGELSQGFKGFLKRQFMGDNRSLEIALLNQNREEVLRLSKPFEWLMAKMTVSARETPLGTVRQRMSLTSKVYELCSSQGGRVIGSIKSSVFKRLNPFKSKDFPLFDADGREIGKISKQYGGLLKEAMTDADTFLVEFPSTYNNAEKAIFLAAAFAIDMDCYEQSARD